MAWFASLYDLSLACAERTVLASWRAELLRDLSGRVLEIGAGTGLNLRHYPQMEALVVSEPDADMRARLVARAQRLSTEGLPVEVTDWPAERLAAPDHSFDAVVATLVWCTVPDPEAGLREVYRVLRPGGRLVFLEHVAGHGAGAQLQHLLEPVWKRLAGNCHLTRRTEQALTAAGFEILERKEARPWSMPPWLWPVVRGLASRP